MGIERIKDIFQCPKCGGKLLWNEKTCSACGASFEIEGNIIDFVQSGTLVEEQQAQILLHDELSREYEKRQEQNYSQIYSSYWNDQFLSRIPVDANRILEVGCGTGGLMRDLLTPGRRVVGLDISKGMLKRAEQSIGISEKLAWVVSPGESIPFKDSVFDVLCFRGAFHHMADEKAALSEAHRVLKEGGLIILSEPNDDSVLLRFPRTLARTKGRFGKDHKAFRSREWLDLIRKTGFTVHHKKYFSFLSQPLCGMSDVLPVMEIIPFPELIAKLLVVFDEICSRLPLVQRQGFDLIVAAKKSSGK